MTAAQPEFGVLVVDDDFMVARIHSRFLQTQEGFRVAGVAHTGIDALAKLAQVRPDLMLLDVHLPDMSGLEVLRIARQDHPEVDVIVVTAERELDSVRDAWQGGAMSYSGQAVRVQRAGAAARSLPQGPGGAGHPGGRSERHRPAVRRGERAGPAGGSAQGSEPGDRRPGAPGAEPDEALSSTECAERVGISRSARGVTWSTWSRPGWPRSGSSTAGRAARAALPARLTGGRGGAKPGVAKPAAGQRVAAELRTARARRMFRRAPRRAEPGVKEWLRNSGRPNRRDVPQPRRGQPSGRGREWLRNFGRPSPRMFRGGRPAGCQAHPGVDPDEHALNRPE